MKLFKTRDYEAEQYCNFGITEALGAGAAAFGGADLLGGLGLGDLFGGLGSLLGIGGADAAAGAAGLGAADAAGGATLADIVGTGTGLFGGATGLEGTALAGGAGTDLGALLGGGAATALGAAGDFLAAPSASLFGGGTAGAGTAFGSAADASLAAAQGSGAAQGIGSLVGAGPTAQPAAFGGVTASGPPSMAAQPAIPGVTGNAIPGGGGAASVAAPQGISSPFDAASLGAQAPPVVPPAAPPTSAIDSLLGDIGGSLAKNPLGIALGAGGLGYNILQGQKQTANQKALSADAASATANADQLGASGQALQQYLTSGTLPPAYEQQVDQAIADAKTTAISNAAQQGLPTDPTQNTALASTLAQIDASRSTIQTQVASQLFSSGSSLISAGQSAAGLSGNLYETLVQNDTSSAANTGKAIATLAAALNGKSSANIGGQTLTLSPSS